jgi:cytosine/adenosine deaminase-related metal-dependent hydrolase
MTVEPVDPVIEGARFVLTQDGDRRFLERTSIAVHGNRIVAIGDRDELRATYAVTRTIDASERLVTPGLVNAHSHRASTRACWMTFLWSRTSTANAVLLGMH